MLTERKLTERELESREVVLRGLLDNKQNLVKKYGKDAEKVMYGIATKKAKSKVESMNKEKIKELIVQSLTKEAAVTSVEDVIDPADYGLIGAGYLAGFGKKHSLDLDQLEELGRKIVKQLYKGDFKAAKAKFIKEDNDPSGADLEGDPNEYVVGEGHGLGQEDLDILKRLLKVGEGDFLQPAEARVLKFLIKSNILQDKTKDLSKGKVDENADQDNAVYELRNIVDQVEELGDEARQIVRQYFPNEMSRMDGYGVFNLAYSNNRYDTTLGSEVDRLEGGDYDDIDDEDYPMQEVGNINRKGEEIPDSDKEAFKKRPSVGLGALLKKESRSLSDYNEDVEKVIKRGIKRINVGSSDEEDVLYYVHNNWMENNITAEEAMQKISDYLSPMKEAVIRKKLGKAPKAGKVASKQKMKLPSGMVSYMDFTESIYEKLTKKNDVGDFVDDFKKSDAKQFKGKSAKKKKEMAVAAYLSKQNEK